MAVPVELVSPFHVRPRPDHTENRRHATLNKRKTDEVSPRLHRHLARRDPEAALPSIPRRHRPVLRQREVGMRPTERRRQPKQLHRAHQAQPALELAPRHPPALLLAAPSQPPPRYLLWDRQHLRRCRRRWPPSGDDAFDVEPPAAETEAEQVPGGEEGAGEAQRELVRRGREQVGGVPRPAARGAHHLGKLIKAWGSVMGRIDQSRGMALRMC